IPATNAAGNPLTDLNPQAAAAIVQTVSAEWQLKLAASSCPLCPLMTVPGLGDVPVYLSQIRGEYGSAPFLTRSNYNAFYGQDVWRVNKYVTANLGLRSEQERVIGNKGIVAYSVTDQWAPRIGLTVDPFARGKTKLFYNFGRFFEFIPLDE